MKRFARACVAVACVLLAACSSGPVRRVSEPGVNIQQLTVRADGSWLVDLRIENFSTVAMQFNTVSLAMKFGGESAGTLQGQPRLSIGPESADVATLAFVPSPAARIVVADALARNSSVDYALDGSVDAVPEKGRMHSYSLKRANALSPVPGVAGVLR